MQDIDSLVNDSINLINDKITGVNLLEKLKYLLIDKLKTYDLEKLKNISAEENNLKNKDLEFLLKIERSNENTSRIKKSTNNDYLIIVLSGHITLTFHDKSFSKNNNNMQYISKKMGIVLSKNTTIDELITKDTILLTITFVNNEKIISD
jgi:hypothetical protein